MMECPLATRLPQRTVMRLEKRLTVLATITALGASSPEGRRIVAVDSCGDFLSSSKGMALISPPLPVAGTFSLLRDKRNPHQEKPDPAGKNSVIVTSDSLGVHCKLFN